MFQMAKYSTKISRECDTEVSASDATEMPESVHLKLFYMEMRRKFDY